MRSCSFLEDVGALLEDFWVAGGLIEYGVGFGLDSRSSYLGMEFHKHFLYKYKAITRSYCSPNF